MTVVTGPTGSGKTTFLSQLSLDFATQSEKPVNCLWGSFEVKNTRLMQKMLHQYSRAPLPITSDVKETEKRLDELCEEFEEVSSGRANKATSQLTPRRQLLHKSHTSSLLAHRSSHFTS